MQEKHTYFFTEHDVNLLEKDFSSSIELIPKNEEGFECLLIACIWYGNYELTEKVLLYINGNKITIPNQNYIIYEVTRSDEINLLSLFFQFGFTITQPPNGLINTYNCTLGHVVVTSDLTMMKMLIDNGANTNYIDDSGFSVLDGALNVPSTPEIIALLIKNEAQTTWTKKELFKHIESECFTPYDELNELANDSARYRVYHLIKDNIDTVFMYPNNTKNKKLLSGGDYSNSFD